MHKHRSKNHWRLYERKCPVRLWENKVLLQHFISWKCPYTPSVPRGCWATSKRGNAPRQVPKPLTHIWEKVPSLASAAMAKQGPTVAFHLMEVPTHPLGTEGVLSHLQEVKCSNTSPKPLTHIWEKVPNSASAAMAKQGPAAAFHLLEVPIHPLDTEGMLRHIQEVKCSNTSPKTIDAYMRKSAQFDYGRTRSWCSISFPGGASTYRRHRGYVEATSGSGKLSHKSNNYWIARMLTFLKDRVICLRLGWGGNDWATHVGPTMRPWRRINPPAVIRTFNAARLRCYPLAVATEKWRQGFRKTFQATSPATGRALLVKIAGS
jgi:hypothetical protein